MPLPVVKIPVRAASRLHCLGLLGVVKAACSVVVRARPMFIRCICSIGGVASVRREGQAEGGGVVTGERVNGEELVISEDI